MNAIKFTTGELVKDKSGFGFYTLTLFNGNQVVYTSTETKLSAKKIVSKHSNIAMA